MPPVALTPAALEFVTERRLATLTTLRPDGTPHVVPVAFTWDAVRGATRTTTRRTTRKARHALAGGRGALCSVDGPRWLTLEGSLAVCDEPDVVAEALTAYAARYSREPREDPLRVVVELVVDRVMSSSHLR